MSENNPIKVFVVHTFAEHPDHMRVFEYLESRPNFYYQNCSQPDATVGSGGDSMREELRRQIEPAEIVILPVTLFAANPVLVTFEIDTAKGMKKPVLAIKSFGETIAIKKSLLDKADDIVDWNNRSITEAIKRLARNDASGQWEVIEFKLD
ncbi:MAG: hypothetical protein IT485_07535 [Gammaproteobacteria bacterium]|nr:hypothetical protein [Gammaproteobacteria bacterium]QOJ31571.1 MAG: hypothetical protein HRU81_05345 [Gammaproteobacteria bacterium]